MSKENRNFILILSVATIMLIGVITQNIVTTLKPKVAKLNIDVEKVKRDLETVGLNPREAMHWKEVR